MSEDQTTNIENLKKEDWTNAKWRPMMGWMYMTVCIFDFIIFPILWSVVQSMDPQGSVTTPWTPLTLQGGGLFHIAMGAVLGVTAYGRTQEKIAGANMMSSMSPNFRSTSSAPIMVSSRGKAMPPPQVDPVI